MGGASGNFVGGAPGNFVGGAPQVWGKSRWGKMKNFGAGPRKFWRNSKILENFNFGEPQKFWRTSRLRNLKFQVGILGIFWDLPEVVAWGVETPEVVEGAEPTERPPGIGPGGGDAQKTPNFGQPKSQKCKIWSTPKSQSWVNSRPSKAQKKPKIWSN